MGQERAEADAARRRGLRLIRRLVVTVVVLVVAAFLTMRFVLPLLPSLREMDLSTEAFAQFMRDAGGWGSPGRLG